MVAVWLVSLSLQVLVTVFFVYIPINNSIEDTPSKLLTIIQGIIVLILGLIAALALGALAIISGALRKVIQKDFKHEQMGDPEWVI